MTADESTLPIDFSHAPQDPIERLLWLSGAQAAFTDQVNEMWQQTYFEVRLSGLLPAALGLGLHSRKRVLEWTRAENERRGRAMHWGDGYSR